jgi:MarR family 2-MHQ and catechol resistance regulon transcriptional repressor
MPTHYKGTPDEVLALDTIIKLTRSLNSVQARLTPLLQKDFGITESQFGVLEVLLHLGPMSLGQLCQKILRSGSNLTTVVDNLERDGLVTRARDETDRRVQIAELTPKGRALIEEAFPAHVSRVASMMSALTADEQRELGRICRKLGRAAIE